MPSGDSRRPSQPPPSSPGSVSGGGDPHRDLAGALHDVSNALTVMLGWVQEARTAWNGPHAADGGVAPSDGAREAVAYALGMIEQRARVARDLARRAIGAGGPVLDQDGLLDTTLGDAVEALRVMAQKTGVRVRLAGDAHGVRVPAAADVAQIVTNLVMNALAHAPLGSEVVVSMAQTDRVIQVDVADQGAGVAPARRDSIFEGDSRREGGAGVGLRYARALAHAAGGDLELLSDVGSAVESRRSSSGARFRLTWPRLDAIPKPPVSAARARVLEGARVLVLEDDGDVTDLLEASLGARGAIVTVARSYAELGVALFQKHDAALVDLSPIASDVKGAFDALRKALPNALVVVMTGSVEALPLEVSSEDVRLVRKPFEVSEIVAALVEPRTKA